jgi:hypothetical protein
MDLEGLILLGCSRVTDLELGLLELPISRQSLPQSGYDLVTPQLTDS